MALCALGSALVVFGGCSEQARYEVLSTVFEGVPKPGEKVVAMAPLVHSPRRPPPPEATPTPVMKVAIAKPKYPPNWLADLVQVLPRDGAGYPDMVTAFNDKKIDPLPAPGDGAKASDVLDEDVKMIPKGKLKCIFSHRVHTTWVSCDSCHPRLFQKKTGEEIAMSDFNSGKFCGACHGKVAFPVKGECIRCHTGMKKKKQKPGEKMLNVSITLVRAESKNPSFQEIPVASFPHLPHRIAYRCYACHDQLFPMKKKGTKPITMQDIDEGRACGVCHNGKDAFASSLDTCSRCHSGAAT